MAKHPRNNDDASKAPRNERTSIADPSVPVVGYAPPKAELTAAEAGGMLTDITVVNNVAGDPVDEEKAAAIGDMVRDAVANLQNGGAVTQRSQSALDVDIIPDLVDEEELPFSIVCVLSDPQGRLFLLHRTSDGTMTFPSGRRSEEPEDDEELTAAANDILVQHAGILVDKWERFAKDEGTDTLYVRAYSKQIYDIVHVCPGTRVTGTMHINEFDAIMHRTPSITKHVRWIAAVSAYAPAMEYILFKCPVG